MAAAYRSSTATNTGASTAGNIVITVPSGVQANDILIAAITLDGGTGSSFSSVPAGWTQLSSATQATNVRLAVYAKVADGYESASYNWVFDTSRMAAACMAAYSGANPFLPFALATNNTTTPSATINGAGANSSYETGRGLQIMGIRNTTAASTITAGSGNTKREDTCTTASAFMEITLMDSTKALPMGGLNSNSATCTQTATAVGFSLFIEDAHPTFATLDADEYLVGSFATSRVSQLTSTMQVNYPNSLLLAFVAINKDVATVSSITGGSLTWTLVARANTKAGSSEIWRAFTPTPLSAAFTINYSASVVSGNFMFMSFVGNDLASTGAGAIGATNTGSSTAAAPSLAVTTTRDKSWVWAIANEGTTSATTTAGASQTLVRNQSDATNTATSLIWRQNALTAALGTTVTMNATSPSTTDCNIAVVEILPAVKKNLGTLGVG